MSAVVPATGGALLLDLVLAVVLVAVAVAAHRLVRDLRVLPAPQAAGEQEHREDAVVSVVVPARDEADSLPALLASLAGQSVPVREVVVVDDASRDATAEVARAAGALVVEPGDPPAGWTGKAWACHRGAGAASGDVLLFLDADVVLAPYALAGLLEAHRHRRGLVSVQPHHVGVRAYEQLSAYFNAVAVMASAAFRRRGPRPAGATMAFGPCLLTSRADLDRAGGHRAVRGAVLDDAALAAAYRAVGLPVWCAVGAESVRMRSYPGGVRRLVSGWSKNIASGAASADPVAAATSAAWVASHHAVAVGAALSLLGLVADVAPTGSPVLWAVAYVATALHQRWLLRRVGSFRWWAWAMFWLPLLAFDVVFARSVVLTVVRRSVCWRGREVAVGGRAAGGRAAGEVR